MRHKRPFLILNFETASQTHDRVLAVVMEIIGSSTVNQGTRSISRPTVAPGSSGVLNMTADFKNIAFDFIYFTVGC